MDTNCSTYLRPFCFTFCRFVVCKYHLQITYYTFANFTNSLNANFFTFDRTGFVSIALHRRCKNFQFNVATLAAGLVFWKVRSAGDRRWYSRRNWLDLNRFSLCYETTEKTIWNSGTHFSRIHIYFSFFFF